MRSVTTRISGKIVLIFLLLAVIGCAAEKRYKILTVFFDGVPRPGEKKEQETTEAKAQAQPGEQKQPKAVEVIRIISRHPDYAGGNCDKCHDRSARNFLRAPTDALCFTCHKRENFQGAFVHGPVAVRACLSCHLPHESRYRRLLIKEDGEICLKCHRQEDIARNPAHKAAGPGQCTECHYAHAAANRFLLKAGIPAGEK